MTNPFTAKAKAKKANPFLAKAHARSGRETGKTSTKQTRSKTSKIGATQSGRNTTASNGPGQKIHVDDLEPGDKVWVMYQWGPLAAGEEPCRPFTSEGEYIRRDQYNIFVQKPDRIHPVPLGCIRKPSWLRKV